MPELDRDAALDWVARWDSQQLGYLPDREERFTALIDAVQEGTSRPDPLVLDLGAGPGSLAVRLLDRLPAATVIAVDADPLLLALGRARTGPPGGRRGEHDGAALAAARRAGRDVRRAGHRAAAGRSAAERRPPVRGRAGRADPGPARPGADRAGGRAAVPGRSPGDLGRLVGGDRRGARAGAAAGRAGEALRQQRASRLAVRAADHAYRR